MAAIAAAHVSGFVSNVHAHGGWHTGSVAIQNDCYRSRIKAPPPTLSTPFTGVYPHGSSQLSLAFTTLLRIHTSLRYLEHSGRRLPRSVWASVNETNSTQAPEKEDESQASHIESSKDSVVGEGNGASTETYPSGELVYKKLGGWDAFVVQCRMLIAVPWQRVRKGSVLKLNLAGQVTEQYQGRFAQGLSLPQICDNLIKAAHDPRIASLFLQIEPLECGWGKIDEIRRHIDYYKKSGKPIVGYMAVGGEKEYYLACACGELYAPPGAYISLLGLKVQAQFLGGVLEKVGVEPQIQRIGKYKSAGDQLSRKNMSEANREMLTALLDDIYENWLQQISFSTGKTREEIEGLLDAGIFDMEKLKEGGWIADIKYNDEIEEILKKRIGAKQDKPLPTVDYRKYSRVKMWTLGLTGGSERIAIIRAVGSISRSRGGGLGASSEGIASDSFIEKVRQVRESKQFKAVVLRIDSPGGDALASDLMWRELKLLADKKPVVASMADVAASGGYYMAMAAGVVVAESLTLTGSIGVVAGKFNLGELYERVGFAKEIISKGKFAELDAEQRPFKPEEEAYFAQSAMNAYTSFRDKAAKSRSMEVEKMEDVAQGRVWTGKSAATRGLVDTLGGFSKAVAIAKQKAGISEDTKVSLVELSSRRQPSPLTLLRGGASIFALVSEFAQTEVGAQLLNTLIKGVPLSNKLPTVSGGIQARMGSISIEGLGTEIVEGSRKISSRSGGVQGEISLLSSLVALLSESLFI